MKENRSTARFELCLAARWQGSGAEVRISDLSLGGCYVDTIIQVVVGETLFLQLRMPEGVWLDLQGVVAHHSPGLGFGVRFTSIDETQKHQIRSLLRKPECEPDLVSDTFEDREAFMPSEATLSLVSST